MCNWAENQEKWDRGDVSVHACYHKGCELRAYNFYSDGVPCVNATPEMIAAFLAGYRGEPFDANTR